MKKKLLVIGLLTVLLIAFSLVGCSKDTEETEPPHTHEMGEWVVETQPSCTAEGTKYVKCKGCDEILLRDTISKTGHVNGEWVVETQPSCIAEGTKYVKCKNCDEVLLRDTIAKIGHTNSDWIVDSAATCTENGAKHVECQTCKTVILSDIILKNGHVDSEWIVDSAATCLADGARHIECVSCKLVLLRDTIAKTGHTESQWIVDVEPTKKVEGSKHIECTSCKKTLKTETILPTGYMDETTLKEYLLNRTVAILINGDIYGSGFFIDEDGTLVTAFHVISDSLYPIQGVYKGIQVKVDGASYDVTDIVKFDYNRDVAVLKIDLAGKKVPYFEITSDLPAVNDEIYACGFSLGMNEAKVDKGNITSSGHTWGIASAYEHSALAVGGNSGGPITNRFGEVIGIHVGSYINSPNMKIAVKIAELDSLKYKDSMTYSDFVEWHLFESREALHVFYKDFDGDYYVYTEDSSYVRTNSYIHTYHEETGAKCVYSEDNEVRVNGYNMNYPQYVYAYKKTQIQQYIAYLKSEGFIYDGNTNFDSGNYIDRYYSVVDQTYIEFYVYTDTKTGTRYVNIEMYKEM